MPTKLGSDFDQVANPMSFAYANSVAAFEIINPLAQIEEHT